MIVAPVIPPGLAENEFPLGPAQFQTIAAMLRADTGIALPETKATLVSSRLARRLRALGLDGFEAYCHLVAGPAGREERRLMLTQLTTNVTRFFREPHHFEHLRAAVLPGLAAAARRGARVRLWSAACSTGQEPYSMALTLMSVMPDAAEWDVKILATDVDPMVIETGRAGRYAEAALAGLPLELRHRWFARSGQDGADAMWEASKALRDLVVFRELNLTGDWPMSGTFQAVMCRNVVIYFDEPTQTALWERLTPRIVPGGHVYIGHSERLIGPAASHFATAGTTTYRRLEGAAP